MSDYPQYVTIYAIQHVQSERSYVGSTKQFAIRKSEHLKALRSGHHHSPLLQNLWSKHGEDRFSFYVLEEKECFSKSERVSLEVKWVLQQGSLNARLPTIDNSEFSMSEQGRKSISKKNSARWACPEEREKWIAANSSSWKDPEAKKLRVAKMGVHLEDPAARAHRSEATKASWTPSRRQYQSAKMRVANPGDQGRHNRWSEEGAKERYAAKMKEFWSNPVRKAAVIKKRQDTILFKKNLSEIASSKAILQSLLKTIAENSGAQ